jgi:SNF family Na+-dependent transporter
MTKPKFLQAYKREDVSRMLLILFVLLIAAPVFAQGAPGGINKVNTFVNNILVVLRSVSIGVVTIAIMWAGYKFLFKHSDLGECLKILGGGLLIGGAAELANYLLS